MKSLLIAVVLLGAARSLDLSVFDPEACVLLTEAPITRAINATVPAAFSSPGFNTSDPNGNTYPANTQCQWAVSIDPGNTLELIFFNFSIENTTGCTDDYVNVYDGADDTAPLIGSFCAQVDPEPPIVASGTELFIRFISNDDAEQDSGFIARVGYPLVVTACDRNGPQVFTNPSGVFATEGYPVSYSGNSLCEYAFQAPAGQVIQISFTDFELADNCNDDWLEVYDGTAIPFGTLGGRFFGSQRPAKLTSATNNAYLRFEADGDNTAPGFFGSYQFVTAQ